MASWFPRIPSKLFLNRSKANHWLRVRVVGRTINRMGIGAKVRIYPAGKIGQAQDIIGYREIGTGFGFCTGQEAVAHFGLGNLTTCDVEVILPANRRTIVKRNVKADRILVIREPLDAK